MPITANVTNEQITASVGETQIDVTVSGGVGPTGAAGASSWNDITSKPSTFAPSAHAASHAVGGADQLFDQSLNKASTAQFDSVKIGENRWEISWIFSGSALQVAHETSNTYFRFKNDGTLQWPDNTFQATAYTGKIGTTSGLVLKTGTDGVIEALAQGTAGQVLKINSGATGVEWVTLGGAASLNVGTTAGTVAAGDHTHAQLHDRSHAITSSSDHTATAWRVFYSNGSGVVTELQLGASGTVLQSNGATAAPAFAAPRMHGYPASFVFG